MNLYKLTHSNSIRRTTSAFELALSVLFLSGIQHYAENPGGMSHVPVFAKQFLQTLPNYWDDVKFIDGFPGQHIVVARRSGTKWYVAGINGEGVPRTWQLNLSALKKTKATLITDGTAEELLKQQVFQISDPKATTVTVPPNGGFVMVLE